MDRSELFSDLEMSELQALFGQNGLELEQRLPSGQRTLEDLRQRHIHWRGISGDDRNPLRREVAEQAMASYSFIIEEVSHSTTG